MLNRPIDTSGATRTPPPPPAGVDLSLEGQVQNALNLYLPLKNRTQMMALLATLETARPVVQAALTSLHYVHFARFLPMPDGSALWVITEYDGGLTNYVMDFVAVLGDEFNAILQFVAGAPPLPVQRHPREFVAFVREQDIPAPAWSAYPSVTVIDILRTARSM
jgi:hypothetical protein